MSYTYKSEISPLPLLEKIQMSQSYFGKNIYEDEVTRSYGRLDRILELGHYRAQTLESKERVIDFLQSEFTEEEKAELGEEERRELLYELWNDYNFTKRSYQRRIDEVYEELDNDKRNNKVQYMIDRRKEK